MIACLKPFHPWLHSSTLNLSIVLLALLGLLSLAPAPAWANSIPITEFVMPTSGYVSFQVIGGSAGGTTQFGLGTSPSNFVSLLSGLPNNPSSLAIINAGYFTAGSIVQMGMFTTYAGMSGWAFSSGTDQASIIAFSDTHDTLGLGGSIYQQTGPHTWVLHLDDALSYLYDDDNNDVLLRMRITSKPITTTTTPEPASGVLLMTGGALVAWRARRRKKFASGSPDAKTKTKTKSV
jgi:hypothetical protein